MSASRNKEHLELILCIKEACDAEGIKVWLLGGWGIDALSGSINRVHHDIDLILERSDRPAYRRQIGLVADSVPEDTAQKLRFLKNGIQCETLFFHALLDGTLVSDLDATDPLLYPWPPGSFPDEINGELNGIPVRAISWSAQFVAKAGYAAFKKNAALRPKDRADLEMIEQHLPDGSSEELQRWFPGIPRNGQIAQQERCTTTR